MLSSADCRVARERHEGYEGKDSNACCPRVTRTAYAINNDVAAPQQPQTALLSRSDSASQVYNSPQPPLTTRLLPLAALDCGGRVAQAELRGTHKAWCKLVLEEAQPNTDTAFPSAQLRNVQGKGLCKRKVAVRTLEVGLDAHSTCFTVAACAAGAVAMYTAARPASATWATRLTFCSCVHPGSQGSVACCYFLR